ncbi:testis-expressed protein 10 homolog [Euwallacea fornicatus]|uniref:testis-expressed protein 10 homolog n=1 Tax=Euwallacea fornicatus TaxID=995702 RepID=UPI00338EC98C
MGKNQRHKKNIKAEKAKVKLKSTKTKFLPKGQNVTNTAFKVRAIVLSEQLKDKTSESILSKRKLNIKDLLSRVRHYNENVRNSACEELSEVVGVFTEEVVQQHLSQITLAISGLMQDRQTKVRKSAAKAVAAILEHVPYEKLVPFYHFFSTNLRCAMTNIDRGIQEDSLKFLDCFIDYKCGLIKQASENLLPDFLSLISKLRRDSEVGRTLTLNLGSKLTSVAWRIKVLSRLYSILGIILKANKEDDFTCVETLEGKGNFPLYKWDVCLKLESDSLDMFALPKVTASRDNINRHIVMLVPLLYETWLEVIPEEKGPKISSESYVLTKEVASLLTCITNTLYLLWKYVKSIDSANITLQSVFLCPEGQKFLIHLLNNFPYNHSGARSTKSTKKLKLFEQNTDPKCVQENLLICFLYLTLHVNCTNSNLKQESGPIVSYITNVLTSKGTLKDSSWNCLFELLSECLGKNEGKWVRSGVDVRMFLENSIVCYQNKKFDPEAKFRLFQILAGVVDNNQLNRNQKYQQWLSTLPNLLCEPFISYSTILELLKLAKKNCHAFTTALLKKLPEILTNLEDLKIDLSSQPEDQAERCLAGIFYYLPTGSEKELALVTEYFHKGGRFKRHFAEVLSLRKELRKI